ncbi:MAG TPA: cytochrome c oxidase assembly protein [Gammaproteobacteria bacterium]|nr:cytochrome c oxidase assembly protein [Gammaproteobacteria bacterium]
MRQSGIAQRSHRRLVVRLVVVVVAMFGFGFALVPLYSTFCKALGLNGRFVDIQDGSYAARSAPVTADKNRTVTVQFLASVNDGLDWEFRPLVHELRVHPGQTYEVKYYARNATDRAVVGQAVPSLAPGLAVKYFTKMECFFFTQQTLAAREQKEMPLTFHVDPRLPREITTLTLAYTFFESKARAATNQDEGRLASVRPDQNNNTRIRLD